MKPDALGHFAHVKIFFAFLFSAIGLLAADDITVTTTTKTNASTGVVTTKDYFARAGQTNLLRIMTKYLTNGTIKTRSHIIFNRGERIAWHLTNPSHGYVDSHSEGDFSVNFTTMSNLLIDIYVHDKDWNAVDWFKGTNGMLTPIPTSELRKYNGKPKDAEGDDK